MRFSLYATHIFLVFIFPLLAGIHNAHADDATSQALEKRRAAAESGVYQVSQGLDAGSEISPQTVGEALDVPPRQLRAAWITGLPASVAGIQELGVIQPRRGDSFTVLSTGLSGSAKPAPGTDLTGADADEIALTVELEPPAGAAHVSFRFRFLTAEFPAFAAVGYNDRFSATLADAHGSRLIADFSADDRRVYPVSASRAGGTGFDLFADDPTNFNTEFGQGLPAAGMSDWITIREPIQGDGPIMIEFRIRDAGDRLIDSAVILDDLSMSAASIHIAPVESGFSTAQNDPADVLINCVAPPVPVPVDGSVADGETRLQFILQTPGPGEVKYSMLGAGAPDDGGFIESFDSRERLNEIVVPVVNQIAHALYLVPDDFNRGGDEGIAERTVTARLEYIPDGDFPAFVTFLNPRIKRPGVAFAHGLWSNRTTWMDEFQARSHPFLTTRLVDYRETNAAHFQTNRLMLDSGLAQLCTALRGEGLAMRQADVIGHSMGGILGRVYEANRPTLINRLITMNTPHLGPPLANTLLALRDNPDLIVRFVSRDIFARMGKPITEGAIDDLAVGSDALNSLPRTSIPSHAMVGVGGKFVTDAIIDGAFTGPVLWFFGIRPSDIFDTPEHDLVVGRDSQLGGITNTYVIKAS